MVERVLPVDFPVLETKRLVLRPIKKEDTLRLHSILSSEKVVVYYGTFPIEQIEMIESIIERYEKDFIEDIGIRWGIALKETDELIGTCGFMAWAKRHKRAQIGYELDENYWRQGYGTEVVEAVINYGFQAMELQRIEALIYPENEGSFRLLEKLGFQYEGLLRSYTYFRNKHQDLKLYARIKNE